MLTPKHFIRNPGITSLRQFDEHMKLYRGYIDNVNNFVDNDCKSKNTESYNLNGVVLHEMYFENLDPTFNKNVVPRIIDIYDKVYAAFHNRTSEFIQAAQISRGWVIFGFDGITDTYRNVILQAHDIGFVVGFAPLVVLDCYEHAYFIDYGTNKVRYVENFIDGINWTVVEKRLANAYLGR